MCRRDRDSARATFASAAADVTNRNLSGRGSPPGPQEPVPAAEVSWMISHRADAGETTVTLLKWALIFLVISIIAGILGFTGVSAASADIARILFYIFVVIFLVLLILGLTIFRV